MIEHAINTECPWSGNRVSPDSLTRYRGHTVGFCNPECRDKFERATDHFDRAIEQPKSLGDPLAFRGGKEIYAPRNYRSEGVLSIGASRFKFYLIEATGETLQAAGVEAAVRDYARACPHVWSMDESALGHIIAHQGTEALWLLVQWWVPGGILRGLMARAPLGSMLFEPADSSLFGCVWEMKVIEHERAAWIRYMMQDPSDIDAFLADRLAPGRY